MQFLHNLNNLFRPARMTRRRMGLALLLALAADGLQIPGQMIPLAPEIIDIVAMVLTTLSLGFHVLLLPTFALEFIPLVDMVPTWTGCVIAVIMLRRREETIVGVGERKTAPPLIQSPPEDAKQNRSGAD